MDNLRPKKIEIQNINGGKRFVNGDVITANTINDMIEGISANAMSAETGGSAIKKTVLFEGEIKDLDVKAVFNSGNNYWIDLPNLPSNISQNSQLLFEITERHGQNTQKHVITKFITKETVTENNQEQVLHHVGVNLNNSTSTMFNMNKDITPRIFYDVEIRYLFDNPEMAGMIGAPYSKCLLLSPLQYLNGKNSGSIYKRTIDVVNGEGKILYQACNPINGTDTCDISITKITLVEV